MLSSVPSNTVCAFESKDTFDKFIVEFPTNGKSPCVAERVPAVKGVA